MKAAARLLNTLVRVLGVASVALGLLFWTGHALTLIPLHMALGVGLVLALWALTGVAAVSAGRLGLVALSVLWGFVLPVLGVMQTRLLPGSLHWLIQVLHLAVGIAAIRLGGALAASIAHTAVHTPAAEVAEP